MVDKQVFFHKDIISSISTAALDWSPPRSTGCSPSSPSPPGQSKVKTCHDFWKEQLLLCLPGGRACGNHRRCRSQSRYYPRSSDPRNPPEIITRPHTAHFNIYILVCKIADLQSENGSVHRVLKLQVLRVPGKSLSKLPQLALMLTHSVTLL